MIVVVPCHIGDQDQALRLLNWIAELGQVNASAMLFCSTECDADTLMAAGKRAFTKIWHEVDAENRKCNWQSNDPGSRDPSGPNSVFRQVAWSIYVLHKQPWLFLEPDSIPLCRDWYSRLLSEYQSSGKIVMGDMVSTNSPHLSGVAVYPYNVPEVFPKMIHNVNGAFDTSSAKEVLAAAHITPLIMDRWRSPEFKSVEDFNKIRPEAVIFHASKDGSLIPFVRQKLGMKGGDEPCPSNSQITSSQMTGSDGAAKFEPSSAPVVDIYLKTYPKDSDLANYCLKSVGKFVTGYRDLIIESETAPESWEFFRKNFKWVKCNDRQPGYIDQQAKKLAAFKHTDAEYILYVDSDCCFQRPFDVSEMFKDGKSTWQYIPWTEARVDQLEAWGPVMERFLGKPPAHEYMRRHPHILPRWLPEEMDKFCKYRHGKSLDEYIMAQGDPSKPLQLSFSEFNCAGFFAWSFFKDRIAWITDAEATPAPLVQGFTHAGPDRIKADIEKAKAILGEDDPKPEWPDVIGSGTVLPVKGEETPRAPLTVASAIEFLRMEATNGPLHKARLWKRITAALGMETKPPAPKRRRKGARKKLPSFQLGADIPVTHKRGRPKKTDEEIFKSKLVTGKAEKRMRAKVEDQAMVDASLCLQPKGWAPSKDGFILAVQTYPGGNEAFGRHERSFIHSGASRRVAITTTDGYCYIPEGFEEVKIGENKYISSDHLPKRLIGILEWFLKQPEERIAIVEYDVLFFKPLKPWTGTCLVPAGGQLPGAKSDRFYHCPWLFDKESAKRLLPQMYGIIAEGVCNTGPEASPDVFLAYAVDRAGITVNTNHFTRFTRNSLNRKGDLELARQHYRDGVDCLHGCKTKDELEYILS